jgi:maltose alpha-D-glucosyltransferase/alpha-amylase
MTGSADAGPRTTSPRFLTLGPSAFSWFALLKSVATEEVQMVPTVAVAEGWGSLLEGPTRQVLERSALPAFLPAQRWFGGKARQLEGVSLADWGDLPLSRAPREGASAVLALLEVRYAGGGADLYFLPLGITTGPAADRLLASARPLIIARLTGPGGEALLHDALADDDTCTALLDAIGTGRECATRSGRICAFATAAFAGLRGPPEQQLPVVRGAATSSNSLVCYGGRLLLKLFRRLEAGTNPDFEIGRFLTEESPFPRIPQVAGTMEYHPRAEGQAEPFTLGILQALVPSEGDGWSGTLDELGRYYVRAAGRRHGPDPVLLDPRPLPELARSLPPPVARDAIGASSLDSAAILGRRTAEMHLALAGSAGNPDFAPEQFTAADATALRASVHEQGRRALAVLCDTLERLPEAVSGPTSRLLKEGPGRLEELEQTPTSGGGAKIRCHGDYHLGQVLCVANDYVILDFEGEPTRTLAERRAKQSPLKDVAGMLRSYHYAAHAGLFSAGAGRPADLTRLEPWAELWYEWVAAAFLREYQAAARPAEEGTRLPLLPAEAQFAGLLDLFLLEKAFYELVYELNNRPDWVRIPLSGILALLMTKRHEPYGEPGA